MSAICTWAYDDFDYDFEKDGICYNILSENDKTVEVAKGPYVSEVIIPSEVNGYSVVAIGESAFIRHNELYISEILGVEDGSMKPLTSITIPNSVTSIGEDAFYECGNLSSIILPEGLTSIGDGAFGFCVNLTSIKIPSSVTYIGCSAFAFSSLESVVIPNGITSISHGAFMDTDLTSVTIPYGVTLIGEGAFEGCKKLSSVKIPNTVTTIEDSAFGFCESLTSIIIPSSVTKIEDLAFEYCNNLVDISNYAVTPQVVYFTDYAENGILHVIKGLKDVYENAEGWWRVYTIIDDLDAENETSIGSIALSGNNDANIYTLDGRATDGNNLKKGVYIKNGKKFFVN